jgi:hypothetical protein
MPFLETRRPSLGGENPIRNRVLERLVAKLAVNCGACEWDGKLECLTKHRETECSHRSVPCRLNCGWLGRCTQEVSRSDWLRPNVAMTGNQSVGWVPSRALIYSSAIYLGVVLGIARA